jgi:2-polyprenyl-6-methoxyphenol hydroxylase-like FAD-dependent oxidoreductase
MGCDGARSNVRKAMAGGGEKDGNTTGSIRMEGDVSDIIWGVMDVEVKTDFPDLMSKWSVSVHSIACTSTDSGPPYSMIHSRDAGSSMVIPREAGLVRFYVQLQEGEDGSGTHVGEGHFYVESDLVANVLGRTIPGNAGHLLRSSQEDL